MLKNLLLLLRPKHWIKNLFIFMPVFFGGALTHSSAVIDSIMAFFAYSLPPRLSIASTTSWMLRTTAATR